MPINVGTAPIFTPFNFAALLSSRNKGYANINGFTVFEMTCIAPLSRNFTGAGVRQC